MYNIQENVRIVIAALKLYNIRHVVVSPGGTNIPISQAVQDDSFFKCYSVVDERSAMYFAIGLYLQTGEIIATSCTSAQATRNYVPGLTEAFYKHTPILAITTSKLHRYNYQEYMQAPDQVSLPRDSVKESFDLPPITDENTRALCLQETRKAILELTHHGYGPIQLNIRITDNLNSKFSEEELPSIRKVTRYYSWEDWSDVSLADKKVLLVIGEHRPFSEEESFYIENFCDGCNSVIYTNHLSNYHGKYSINANLLISCLSHANLVTTFAPDIIITLGGQTGDYPLFGLLNQCSKKVEHWRVAEDGNYVDTYCKLTKIFECPDNVFLKKMGNNAIRDHSFFEQWNSANHEMNRNVDLPFSNIYAASKISQLIPPGSFINFAILNSLRAWSYYDLDPTIKCFSNVSAFGIDGCTSTLIGESMNTDSLCFMITGDLAFFYDMNSIGIRHIRNNVRIMLINNGGGAEFKIMTSGWATKTNVEPYISACGHNGTAKGWAEACGFEYLSASGKMEFENQIELFLNQNGKPILFEIFTKPEDELAAINSLVDNNRKQSVVDGVKSLLKKILGEEVVERVKNMKN